MPRVAFKGGAVQAAADLVFLLGREGAGADARLSSPPDQTGTPNLLLNNIAKSLTRARTGAFFESREDAFSTRTARFIIQDNFPHPVPNTMAGPLYGVQFSTLPFSDHSFNSNGTVTGPAISGDPGGLPMAGPLESRAKRGYEAVAELSPRARRESFDHG